MTPNDRLAKLLKLYAMRRMTLARAVNVDSSLVSKWASGKRRLDVGSPYLLPIAKAFAATHLPPEMDRRARHVVNALDDPLGSDAYVEKILHYLVAGTPIGDVMEEDRVILREMAMPDGAMPKPRPAVPYAPGRLFTCEVLTGDEGYAGMLSLLERELLTVPEAERRLCVLKSDANATEDPQAIDDLNERLLRLMTNHGVKARCVVTLYNTIEAHLRACRQWLQVMLHPNAELRLSPNGYGLCALPQYDLFVIPNRLYAHQFRTDKGRMIVVARDPKVVEGMREQLDALYNTSMRLYQPFGVSEWERFCQAARAECLEGDVRWFTDGLPPSLMPSDLYRRLVQRAGMTASREREACEQHDRALASLLGAKHRAWRVLCSRQSVARMLARDGYVYPAISTFWKQDVRATASEVREHVAHVAQLLARDKACQLVMYDDAPYEVTPSRFVIQLTDANAFYLFMWQDQPIGISLRKPVHNHQAAIDFFDQRWDRLVFQRDDALSMAEELEALMARAEGT